MAAPVSQSDYLKRYLSSEENSLVRKKKKVKKVRAKGLKVFDEDVDIHSLVPGSPQRSREDVGGEDAPTVAQVVDERPKEEQLLDVYKTDKWKVIGNNGKNKSDAPVNSSSGPQHQFDSGSDQSPRRKRPRSNKGPSSPERDRKNATSPLRRRRHDSGGDQSPPRRQRHDSGADQSPPRSRRHDSGADQSPPRRRRHDSGANQSPPRRRRHDSGADQSPPRSRRHDSGADQSPPRRRRHDSGADQSPPRRRRHDSGGDQSPPRRRRHDSGADQSPPRRRRQDSGADQSPPRRQKQDSRNDRSSPRRPSSTKSKGDRHKMTLDGKVAGLSSAKAMQSELKDLKKKSQQLYNQMGDEEIGRNAGAVMRSGEVSEEKTKQQEELRLKYAQWGKGVAQTAEEERRLGEFLHEANKPLARQADDSDMNREARERLRPEDPMYQAMMKKKEAQKSQKSQKPTFQGDFPPNRYSVRPGYRWDGRDRSNGFEKKFFSTQSNKKAVKQMAYKWSVEDM